MKMSFAEALLRGQVSSEGLEPFPVLSPQSAAEIEPILDTIRRTTAERDGVSHLKEWGLLLPPERWSPLELTRVVREVAGTDVSAALSLIAHLALGLRLLTQFGTQEQIHQVSGHPGGAVLAFALTEANPGSDVSQIQTYAQSEGGAFVLSGTKHWVTNAMTATHFVVLARTVLPHAAEKPRMTAFLVPRGEGVSVRPVQTQVLLGAGVGEVSFENVRLEPTQILGAEGKGFRLVMRGLSEARLLVGAAVLGACIRSFNETVSRLNQRRAFGRPVGNFPSVQDRISSMLADIVAMESLVHGMAGRADRLGELMPLDNALVRLAASRTSSRVLDAARELHGAAAFAGKTQASRRWADTRALTLLDGSDLALESYLILEGTRPLRHEISGLAEDAPRLAKLEILAKRVVRDTKSRLIRAIAADVPGGRVDALHELTHELARVVSHELVVHGLEIVEMQHLQRRLATISTDLATWACLATRVGSEIERHGGLGSRRMAEVSAIWVSAAEVRLRAQFRGLSENDDRDRDRIASRAYADQSYPFDLF